MSSGPIQQAQSDQAQSDTVVLLRFRAWAKPLFALLAGALAIVFVGVPATAQELIFRKSTVFKLLTPNDKLATYAIDDPLVDGVACHYTVPEKGGVKGMFGVAEEVSDVSLACRQFGPVVFKEQTICRVRHRFQVGDRRRAECRGQGHPICCLKSLIRGRTPPA
jgi:hypothetical protein